MDTLDPFQQRVHGHTPVRARGDAGGAGGQRSVARGGYLRLITLSLKVFLGRSVGVACTCNV